jgi:hypothetical protein
MMGHEIKSIRFGRRGFATRIASVSVLAAASAAGGIAYATTALKTTASRFVTSVGIVLLVALSLAAGSARAVQDGFIAYTQSCDGRYVTLTVTAAGQQPYESMTFSLYLSGPGYLAANPQQIESDANAVATATFSGLPSAGATVYLLVHSPSVGFLYTHDFALSDCSPQAQLSALIAQVQGLDATAGITNSLDAKLSHIQDALSAAKNNSLGVACNSLDAFLNEVVAQAQSHVITAVQAAALTNAAMSIKSALGC